MRCQWIAFRTSFEDAIALQKVLLNEAFFEPQTDEAVFCLWKNVSFSITWTTWFVTTDTRVAFKTSVLLHSNTCRAKLKET